MTVAQLDPRIPALIDGFDAPFFLAGLAGYSDGAMRMVARHYGSPFCVTESLRADMIVRGGKGLAAADPNLPAHVCLDNTPRSPHQRLREHMGTGHRADNPLAAQIIGNDPELMAEAAVQVAQFGYAVIDVNLACPPKRSRKRSCQGGQLLADPKQAIDILRAVRAALPAELPTTVKLRRAYDDTLPMQTSFEQIFEAAYELNYAWATVHCRTVEQRYDGPGRWSFLSDLTARYPDRLIFGSGDIWSAADIFAMLERTGVHAVAVARGGIANPWIFQEARQRLSGYSFAPPLLAELLDVLELHARYSEALFGHQAAARQMRKFSIKFAEAHAPLQHLKPAFIDTRNLEQWSQIIQEART